MFQLIDIRYVCLVDLLLHDTSEKIAGFKSGEFRHHKSGGMKGSIPKRPVNQNGPDQNGP